MLGAASYGSKAPPSRLSSTPSLREGGRRGARLFPPWLRPDAQATPHCSDARAEQQRAPLCSYAPQLAQPSNGNAAFSPFTHKNRGSTVPAQGSFSFGTDSQKLPLIYPTTPRIVTEPRARVLSWQPRASQERNGAHHPTSGASCLPSHHPFHLTNGVIKRSW